MRLHLPNLQYDAGAGQVFAMETLGPLAPFNTHINAGLGHFLTPTPMDRLQPGYGIAFLMGINWDRVQISYIFRIVRVRSVNGRKEIDAKLWANLYGDRVVERITVAETEDCWFQYVLNSEGLIAMNSFVHELGYAAADIPTYIISKKDSKPQSVHVILMQSSRSPTRLITSSSFDRRRICSCFGNFCLFLYHLAL